MIKLIVPVEAIEKSKSKNVTIDVTDHYRLAEAAADVADHLDNFGHKGLTDLAKRLRDALMGSPDDPPREIVPLDDPEPVVPLIDVLSMAEDAEDAGHDGLASDLYLALMGELRRRIEDLAEPHVDKATS
jgi:hypothetical protein